MVLIIIGCNKDSGKADAWSKSPYEILSIITLTEDGLLIFYVIWGWKIASMVGGVEFSTLDLKSQSGAFDHSATAIHRLFLKRATWWSFVNGIGQSSWCRQDSGKARVPHIGTVLVNRRSSCRDQKQATNSKPKKEEDPQTVLKSKFEFYVTLKRSCHWQCLLSMSIRLQ